ncbi:MAG: HD domain-containing protein [Lachnospiraceae bacterium]|nr:HD domain-containing protein [Lachnospiraceae bacterium]
MQVDAKDTDRELSPVEDQGKGADRELSPEKGPSDKDVSGNAVVVLPGDVKKVIKTLEDAGYHAFAVGGCVRDSFMGRKPQDWDITTSAKPEEIKKVFKRTVDTGIKHGTVTVLIDKRGYEVTTFRIDGEYTDQRHPDNVTFTEDLEEDLRRRDFTINAMAWSDSKGLVDIYGGTEDLKRGLIRAVGDPYERFGEDALRILRAVRFSAQLGFEIEEQTQMAAGQLSYTIAAVSAERIREELMKILVSDRPYYLKKAWELGITAAVMPELDRCMECGQNNPHHMYSVGEHILHSMENIASDPVLRLTMLFHDMGKPEKKTVDKDGITHNKGHAEVSAKIADEVLHRLKFDNATISSVTRLVKWHELRLPEDRTAVRRAVNKVGEDIFPLLFPVKIADTMAQSDYKRAEKLAHCARIKAIYEEIKRDGDPVTLKDLAVKGQDLKDAGVAPGPDMGRMLGDMLNEVLDDPSKNNRDYLIGRYVGK